MHSVHTLARGETVTPKELAALVTRPVSEENIIKTEKRIRGFARKRGIVGDRSPGSLERHARHHYDADALSSICEHFKWPVRFRYG